ncbi:MAG TPA: hypothetical protein PLA92_11900, partial [Fimbriimonadaceae bacterium]|nr:hypothetical protein [Fimbriimonadaceae bacterium]
MSHFDTSSWKPQEVSIGGQNCCVDRIGGSSYPKIVVADIPSARALAGKLFPISRELVQVRVLIQDVV